MAGTPAPRAALDAAQWAGGFAAPMGLVESGQAWTIEIGTELMIALPAVRERVPGIRPLPPRAATPPSAGSGKPSKLARARRATARQRARADGLHEQLQATSARADRLAVELEQARAELEREAEDARRTGEEMHVELARVSASLDTALARNREVEGLLLLAQQRERLPRSEPGVEVESERVEELEREAEEARRAGRQAQAELARVSAAHDEALARNREIAELLLLADNRARQLQVEVQDRLVVARKVAATREAQRRREAEERRLAERQAGARKSAQRIEALDRALTEALAEERKLVEAFGAKGEQTETARLGSAA